MRIPTIAYPGGKVCLAKEIISFIPGGRLYIEPFVGRGNVFFALVAMYVEKFLVCQVYYETYY